MRQAGSDVIVIRQRKNLRLILEPAKGAREDQPIGIAAKFRARRSDRLRLHLAAEPFRAEELRPLHAHRSLRGARTGWRLMRSGRGFRAAPIRRWCARALPAPSKAPD